MSSLRLPAAAAAITLAATLSLAAQTPAPQKQSATPATISLIGCVERVMPATPARGSASTPQTPSYKLIDVQPGTVGQQPITLGREYQLKGPATIDFATHQNHWVEVTGTVAPPAPPVAASSGRNSTAAQKAAAPLPVFTATAVKVVSNECK